MAARQTEQGWVLGQLVEPAVRVPPECQVEIRGLAADSRQVRPGDLFLARQGRNFDAERFVPDAVRAGAAAVLRRGSAGVARGPQGVPEVTVPDPAAFMGEVAHRFFGAPSEALRVVGITGPNGKTTVAHHAAHVLHQWRPGSDQRSAPCGLMGTLGNGLFGALETASHTTADTVDVHRQLGVFRARGARHAVMEVSSHGLDQHRVAGVHFHTAVFTNLTRDHLDYHGDMASYAAAKQRLFQAPGLRHAVVNVDDDFGGEILAALPPGVEPVSYRLVKGGADVPPGSADRWLAARAVQLEAGRLRLRIESSWGEGELDVPLIGRFNGANLLAVLGVVLVNGMAWDEALERMARLTALPGRMQPLGGESDLPLVVVDYAHTPDALERALNALRSLRPGRLWCIFGCGGERDSGKRALMGAVAGRLADRVVVTDDNPRGEDGDAIVAGILSGLGSAGATVVERDRRAAIGQAITEAASADTILVAGKGHEDYQEVKGVRHPFSDGAEVKDALQRRRGR